MIVHSLVLSKLRCIAFLSTAARADAKASNHIQRNDMVRSSTLLPGVWDFICGKPMRRHP